MPARQLLFDEVVRKCMTAGLVTGKLLLTDSTHILANAAKEKREIIEVPDTPSEYVKKLDREALEAGLLDEPVTYPEKTRTVTKSTTDPGSGLMNRPGKPNAFCYLNHQTSDAESGIITDVFVTPGNVNDCTPHTSRLETQIDKFGLAPPGDAAALQEFLPKFSPLRHITYTRTGGFCYRKLLDFSSGRTQNPPVLWLTESVCSCPEQPLSATHGRQRYNTLDFSRKVVCHETAGFIGFFLPLKGAALHWMPPAKAAPPPLETTAKGCGSPVATSKCRRHFEAPTEPAGETAVPFGILCQQGAPLPIG